MKKNKFIIFAFTFLLIVATCILPFDFKQAKANVIGDLTSNELLSPTFKIDSLMVSNYSNSTIFFGSYPNYYDTTGLTSNPGSYADPLSNSYAISAMKHVGYTSSTSPLMVGKMVSTNAGNETYIISDLIMPASSSPFGNGGNTSSRRLVPVDFDFYTNELVISRANLFNVGLLLYKNGSSAITGNVDINVEFTLNSKTTSGGVDSWVISSYDLSNLVSYDVSNLEFVSQNSTNYAFNSYIYEIPIFQWFSNELNEEEDIIWLSDINITVSLGTSDLYGVGFNSIYYNPVMIGESANFNKWLEVNNLLESTNIGCPECPVCSICPGQDVNIDFTSWIATAVGGFLAFEIFPGFSLVGILAVFISIAVVIWILKMIAGG